MKLQVRVKPNSGKQELIKIGEVDYVAYLKSKPEDGKANAELINFLSKHFGVPAAKFKIKSGLTNRNKIIEIISKE